MTRGVITSIFVMVSAFAVNAEDLKIGLVYFKNDPRFDERLAYARVPSISKNSPVYAAEIAISDMKWKSEAANLTVYLDTVETSESKLSSDVMMLLERDVKYVILDLPGKQVQQLMNEIKGKNTVFFNSTSRDDYLRFACKSNLYHIAASNRMVSDALAQYMVRMGFKNVLALSGPTSQDKDLMKSFKRSSDRLNLKIKKVREFSNSNNPQFRDKKNVRLLTNTNFDYDVIFVADTVGEFAKDVPYRTAKPRLVIGSSGLTASEWHWSLERYGAPQVNSRYNKKFKNADKMNWQDWSIWLGVKIVILHKIQKAFPGKDKLTDITVDGSTGRSLSFRPWSKQLRMPLMLSTQNTVVNIAPIKNFLHEFNTLDSLGYDQKEFRCYDEN